MTILTCRIGAKVLALVALLALSGCGASNQPVRQDGLQSRTHTAPLPIPLTDIKLVYITETVGIDQSKTRPARGVFTNYVDSYGEAEERLRQLELNKVDDKVSRLGPRILLQHGLKGDITTFVATPRFTEVSGAATAAAQARGESVQYWLVIFPESFAANRRESSVRFEIFLSNLLDRKIYWEGFYMMYGAPVNDGQVQTMLDTVIADIKRQP